MWSLFLLCTISLLVNGLVSALDSGCNGTADYMDKHFPESFLFGASTSAYQVEGGVRDGGRIPCVWDYGLHNVMKVPKPMTADVACDSYHKYEVDVQMLVDLGVDTYRMSIAWPRILNFNTINRPGLDYYDNLINLLLENNIQPIVTMVHFDLPQQLQDLGGVASPLFIDYFTKYARLLFDHFGDRVKYWLTFNELLSVCSYYYGSPLYGIGVNSTMAFLLCSKNALLAHASVYHMYDNEYRYFQNGMISMSHSSYWFEPMTDSQADIDAASEAFTVSFLQYAVPLYSSTGDWSEKFKRIVADYSRKHGYSKTILPEFTPYEIDYIRGSYDFVGINIYTAMLVSSKYSKPPCPAPADYYMMNYGNLIDVKYSYDCNWTQSQAMWLHYTPHSIYGIVTYIKEHFNNPLVLITENGWATSKGLNDTSRVKALRGYMSALYDAMEEGCNVIGYTVWGLMDNFEWTGGYSERFGLFEVNFRSAKRTRTPRMSAYVYKDIIKKRYIDPCYNPNPTSTSLKDC